MGLPLTVAGEPKRRPKLTVSKTFPQRNASDSDRCEQLRRWPDGSTDEDQARANIT